MTNFSRSGNSPPRRINTRPLGGVRNTVQDTRPAQAPPKPDTSVLVHNCFDQRGGESKPTPCGCSNRISRLDSSSLIRRGKADLLVFLHLGKPKKNPDSIVLRREYVEERLRKTKISGRKTMNAMLEYDTKLSFRKGTLRDKNGNALRVDMNRTDELYWNTVLVQFGHGVRASLFLKQAPEGMGLPVSFTTLEPFQAASVRLDGGIDPEIDEVMAITIAERKRIARPVLAAGFVKGTSGGLTYGAEGKIVESPAVYSPGLSPGSDDCATIPASRVDGARESTSERKPMTKRIRDRSRPLGLEADADKEIKKHDISEATEDDVKDMKSMMKTEGLSPLE